MKRKILSLVTALALCLSLFPAPALAAEGDGTALTVEELAKNSTGPGTFTVACAHASVGTVTASNPQNGVVTVTAHCTACGKDITLGTLTMVNDGLTITYGDEIPTFAVQAQGLEVATYQWQGKELAESSPQDTPPFEGLLGPQSHSCTVTFNVPGGSSETVKLTFTLTVNQLDITTATVTAALNPGKSTYNGQGQTPSI